CNKIIFNFKKSIARYCEQCYNLIVKTFTNYFRRSFMMTKTVIIGTNHAGIAAANTLLDNYPDQEVVMIDRNSNLSYLGCGTALWVGRQVNDYHGLFYTKVEDFTNKGAKITLEAEVKDIDFDKKVVHYIKKDGTELTEDYDKLILATGSLPISPNVAGKDLNGI